VRQPVVTDRHLGDHREVGQGSHRSQRLVDLVHVGKRLQDESVHPARDEAPRLALKVRERLFARRRAERLDANAQRPDRADDARAPGGRRRASSAAAWLIFSVSSASP